MFLNKEFCADGIGLRVEAWITFFNKQHLVHKAFELLKVALIRFINTKRQCLIKKE